MQIILERDEYLNLKPNPFTEKLLEEIENTIALANGSRIGDRPALTQIQDLIDKYKKDTQSKNTNANLSMLMRLPIG